MPRKIRPIRVDGQLAYVTLTKGYTAVIDAADVPLVERFNWYALVHLHTVYAMRADYSESRRRVVGLHRVIMGDPIGLDVDHRDSDGLNNRRKNLRVATESQNLCNQRMRKDNTSGYKGVSLHRATGRWAAYINLKGKRKNLGLFNCPTSAHCAYINASRELHGEFGRAT